MPGVARVVRFPSASRDLDEMTEAALAAIVTEREFDTFKVAARRNHTDFVRFDGQTDHRLGAVRHAPQSVKMKPDVTVGVEVVQNAAYVYALAPGVGGCRWAVRAWS
ncbi:MAG: THUMP domain-containing protein [Eggerthella lenta]